MLGEDRCGAPHAFGIGLHVDNSAGVAMEGEQYGFEVCLVEPGAGDWVERVLGAVEGAAVDQERNEP